MAPPARCATCCATVGSADQPPCKRGTGSIDQRQQPVRRDRGGCHDVEIVRHSARLGACFIVSASHLGGRMPMRGGSHALGNTVVALFTSGRRCGRSRRPGRAACVRLLHGRGRAEARRVDSGVEAGQLRESCLRRQSRDGRAIAKKAGAGQPGAGAQLPADWLPSARIFRVIVHWTGGSHRTSRFGRNHHHILIEASPKLIRSIPSIVTNDASEVSPWLRGAQARLQRSNLRRCLKSGMPYVPKISL